MNYIESMFKHEFIQDMEILLGCKRYVEHRLETMNRVLEKYNKQGRDTDFITKEIEHLEQVLGIRPAFWNEIVD